MPVDKAQFVRMMIVVVALSFVVCAYLRNLAGV